MLYPEDNTVWKKKLYKVIFESNTAAGKTFDILLIITIALSIFVVMMDSVSYYNSLYGNIFYILEWTFTILFTTEYILRIVSVKNPWKYITSFYGVIDLLSIIPTYFSLLVPGTQYLMLVRTLRLLRLFRVLKMVRYVEGSSVILRALRVSAPKIIVFLFTIFSITVIAGAVMYIIEGPENGFTNIPESMYWAIVTITTVGYGDISPQTSFGKMIASVMMIFAYGILAVPTGIVTYEIAQTSSRGKINTKTCKNCTFENHDPDADFCKKCGEKL
ncbi:MAG: ion transporter [Clostridia bacterium]|nr:ion transporter [Clostridia bacterium]